jgi:hypothetical protein
VLLKEKEKNGMGGHSALDWRIQNTFYGEMNL